MSFTDAYDAAMSDDVDDVEVGATIYSKSRFDGTYPLGGVVAYIEPPFEDNGRVFHFIYFRNGQPVRDRFVEDDVNTATMGFAARDATGMAQNIRNWLARHGRKLPRVDKVGWDELVLNLDKAGMVGSYTPKANARYEAALEERAS